jgi:2-hydroxychromene-2-carboxylate isomerase
MDGLNANTDRHAHTNNGIAMMHADKENDIHTRPKDINRRDVLIAGAGLTAATIAGTSAMAGPAVQEEKLHEPYAGFEIPLPESWIGDHYNENLHPPIKELPAPLTATVNEKSPLEFDLYWSMRSPYSYLVLDRILALNKYYNVKINFMPTLPIAVKSGGFPGVPWYRWNYDMMDQHRVAKRLGIPFRRPRPEVVLQNSWPPYKLTLEIPEGEKNQPNVYLVTRCAAAAQLQGKGLQFLDHVSHMLWDGTVDNWPEHLGEYMDRAGMDGKAILADVKANPKKYDDRLNANNKVKAKTGHGGVPLMVFRGEPFFGQDKFDVFFWRLARNGLTRKDGAALPSVSWTG